MLKGTIPCELESLTNLSGLNLSKSIIVYIIGSNQIPCHSIPFSVDLTFLPSLCLFVFGGVSSNTHEFCFVLYYNTPDFNYLTGMIPRGLTVDFLHVRK